MVETPLIYATFITQHCYSTCYFSESSKKALQFQNCFLHIRRSSKTTTIIRTTWKIRRPSARKTFIGKEAHSAFRQTGRRVVFTFMYSP